MSVKHSDNLVSDVVLNQNQRSVYRQVKFKDRQGKIKTTEVMSKSQPYRLLILPITVKGQLLLVEDYFAGIGRKLYAGLHEYVASDNQPILRVEEVCREKLGMKVDLTLDYTDFLPLPSSSNEKVQVVLAYSSSTHINLSESFGDQARRYQIKAVDIHDLGSLDDLCVYRYDPLIDGATLAAALRIHAGMAGIPKGAEISGPMLLGYMYAKERIFVNPWSGSDDPDVLDVELESPFKESSRDTTEWERGIRIFERVQKALSEVHTWS